MGCDEIRQQAGYVAAMLGGYRVRNPKWIFSYAQRIHSQFPGTYKCGSV